MSDVDVLIEALAWLIGDPEAVEADKSSSYHGPELTLVSATTSNKRKAMHSFTRLGESNIRALLQDIEQRTDDQNVLHFRLALDDLIDGKVVLASDFAEATVKGQAKFEVYSGRSAEEQRRSTLDEALELAMENGAE